MLQSKLNTVCLVIIAISLALIAFRQLQPAYTITEGGKVIDSHSGKLFQPVGSQLVPVEESAEEKLRKEYPDGKKYK